MKHPRRHIAVNFCGKGECPYHQAGNHQGITYRICMELSSLCKEIDKAYDTKKDVSRFPTFCRVGNQP